MEELPGCYPSEGYHSPHFLFAFAEEAEEAEKDIDEVTSQVEWDIQDRENVSVEEIQDIVEQELMKYDFYDIAKKYITYRQKHAERRAAQKHLMSSYRDIFFADAVDVENVILPQEFVL